MGAPRRPTEVTIEGARELRRALKGVEGGITDLKATNLAAAEIVSEEAATLAPVDSGDLKATVRAAGTQRAGIVRAGKAKVAYAGVTHFGWPERGIAPRPFLYDALDNRRGQVIAEYEKSLDRLIRDNGLD